MSVQDPTEPWTGSLADRIIKAFVAALVVFVTVLAFTQVVLRYAFSSSIGWADEIGRYGFVWIVFLTAGLATGTKVHIAFSVLTARLSIGHRRAVELVEHLLVGILGFVVAVKGWSIVAIGFKVLAPSSRIPIAYFQLILVVFGALLIWKSAAAAWRVLRRGAE